MIKKEELKKNMNITLLIYAEKHTTIIQMEKKWFIL